MRHSDSNFGGGDMPCSDNDGGSSIEPKNIEDRGNPVADDDGTEAQKQARRTAAGIGVGDHNLKISGGELKKYKGVSRSLRKWIARISNGRNDDGTKNQIYLGTFRTAEMAAIVFDTAVIHIREIHLLIV
jgi:hypothetical protein